MTKLFLFLMLSASTLLSSESWRNEWVKGSVALDQEKYEEAERFFNLAINEVIKVDAHDADYIFVDRAKACFYQKKYEQTFSDAQHAIELKRIKGKDLSNAYFLKYLAELNLGMDEEAIKDYKYLVEDCKIIPQTEFSEEYIIIRNIPDCKCYVETMKKLMVLTGDCEKESDILVLKSGIMIAKRKKDCGCGCSQKGGKQTLEDCKWWCDKINLTAQAWCSNAFKKLGCQVMCLGVVDYLKAKCYNCCESGDFYKNCVKWFEDIGTFIDTSKCDPFFD